VDSAKDLPETIKKAIESTFTTLLPAETNLEKFNDNFLSSHPNSPAYILSYSRSLLELYERTSETYDKVVKSLRRLYAEDVPPSIPTMLSAIQLLQDSKVDQKAIEGFKEGCRARLPLAWIFASKAEQESRQKQVEETEEGTDL